MSARIIDGKAIAAEIRQEITADVGYLKVKHRVVPGLAAVLVGDDPASQVYVRTKRKACREVGIYSAEHRLPTSTSEGELIALLKRLNEDNRIHGILLQSPLPFPLKEERMFEMISPMKDADGFHPENVGRLLIGEPRFVPCTPYGVQQMLIRSGIPIEGRDVVIVGRSNIVGKPLAALLMQKASWANATVTICHTGTRNLAEQTRRAEILIAAAGRPRMITAEMVSEGVVVIDVGTNRIDGKLVGDVEFEGVAEKASAIAPVPGGVGPMTVTMLLYNTVRAARMAYHLE